MVNCCDLPAFLATEEVAPHGQLVDVAPKGPRDREELFRGDQEAEISCSVEVLRIRKKRVRRFFAGERGSYVGGLHLQ